MTTDCYYRFHYDNDFFGGTDYYYTQGIKFEYVHPALKKLPIMKLLVRPRNGELKYGIGIDLFGYTPTIIRSRQILYGDRPYAGCISFNTFMIGVDTIRQQRLSSAMSVGIIGSGAFGREIQTFIHRTIGKKIPQGWKHEIRNDLILNYQINYEKSLVKCKNLFLLNGIAEIRAGTLNTKLSGGLNMMIGNFENPYSSIEENSTLKRKVSYYLYAQTGVTFIGYDATLQGGLLNRKSPYTIPSSQIARVTAQTTAGIVFNFRKVSLSYSKSYLTKEFDTGKKHDWGEISVGIIL